MNRYDIVIIGGGAYGSALAYEASSRGLKALVLERDDFGSGASENSLKIVHGGLRYLQTFDLIRARASCKERSTFLRIAPDLVKPVKCVMPTFRTIKRSRLAMRTGLLLNALISHGQNEEVPLANRMPHSQIVGRTEVADLAPGLQMEGVTGGAVWHDALMINSERLTLALALTARARGAKVRNYFEVESLLSLNGRVSGVRGRDRLTGDENEFEADCIVSCTGALTNRLVNDVEEVFRPNRQLKAVNLVLPDFELRSAVGFPARTGNRECGSERLLFAVPWRGLTLVGTWYRPIDEVREPSTRFQSGEIESMLSEVNSGMPGWSVRDSDIRMVHVGVLPATSKSMPYPINSPTVYESSDLGGLSGYWRVIGEKWTTARKTAQAALDQIAKRQDFKLSNSVSSTMPLETGPEELIALGPESLRYLVSPYGEVVISDEQLEAIRGSLRSEMVRTLSDILLRRTNLGAGGRPPRALTDFVSRVAAEELNWDEQTRVDNVTAFHEHPRYHSQSAFDEPK